MGFLELGSTSVKDISKQDLILLASQQYSTCEKSIWKMFEYLYPVSQGRHRRGARAQAR